MEITLVYNWAEVWEDIQDDPWHQAIVWVLVPRPSTDTRIEFRNTLQK